MLVLVVEDEFLVASAVEMALDLMGHEVLGPIATVDSALAALNDGPQPDAAIVDLNLRGQRSEPIALELERRRIPFVFATGYEVDSGLKSRFPSAQWLRKPYTDGDIRGSLAVLTDHS